MLKEEKNIIFIIQIDPCTENGIRLLRGKRDSITLRIDSRSVAVDDAIKMAMELSMKEQEKKESEELARAINISKWSEGSI